MSMESLCGPTPWPRDIHALFPKPQFLEVGVFRDLELVLLVGVEVFVEGVGGEADGFGD